MQTLRILILEDDLETLSLLLKKLSLLEKELEESFNKRTLSVVILSEYTQVEEYINKNHSFNFDAVLLDRDCKVAGSFHILNIEAVGPDKIISISSVPEYNDEAVKRGIKRIVWKDYKNLEDFSDTAIAELRKIIE